MYCLVSKTVLKLNRFSGGSIFTNTKKPFLNLFSQFYIFGGGGGGRGRRVRDLDNVISPGKSFTTFSTTANKRMADTFELTIGEKISELMT